jgi:protein gp37
MGVPFFFKQWGGWAPQPYKSYGGLPEYTGKLIGPFTTISSTFKRDEGKVTFHAYHEEGGAFTTMAPVGKKAAGRLLDGREHNEYPE